MAATAFPDYSLAPKAPARRGRRPAGNTTKQEAQLVWALALEGDINETHKGGNASKTFNARLKRLGVKLDPKDVYNRLSAMEKRGWIARLIEDKRCFAIRLTVDPEQAGPNPYGGRLSPPPSVPATVPAINGNGSGKHPVLDQMGDLSIRERLEIATALVVGVKAELDTLDGMRI